MKVRPLRSNISSEVDQLASRRFSVGRTARRFASNQPFQVYAGKAVDDHIPFSGFARSTRTFRPSSNIQALQGRPSELLCIGGGPIRQVMAGPRYCGTADDYRKVWRIHRQWGRQRIYGLTRVLLARFTACLLVEPPPQRASPSTHRIEVCPGAVERPPVSRITMSAAYRPLSRRSFDWPTHTTRAANTLP